MFQKILIANRGEIACRIIATAQRMGIATVAVYSEADATAQHRLLADESVCIGPAASAQSYLCAEKIIAACKATGAQAVHPGYGFLSERESFARALADAGIVFIGPPPAAIAAMGDKIESKKLALKAGVNVVPGHAEAIASPEDAVKIAEKIGFPVMIKASAGGGGKGMRIAHTAGEVAQSFQSAQNEARTSFGDDRVLIEKFIVQPRHIEIQLLGDQHGTLLSLHERECSIQRRHQKVVEEAPSPFVTPAMRQAMSAQAIALARAVGYYSAGTVEFIAGADRSFYFLEMNTRLQVEHPVTEMITGLDLVEQMIRIAAGQRLTLTQDKVQLNGWAIETRLYAEDAYRNFLPSTGRLTRYLPPVSLPQVRVDDGVSEGSEVSMFYDPMIAKLITHGPDRASAIAAQSQALDRYVVRGVRHNIDFLAALMAHPRFQSGALTTAFLDEEYPDGFHGTPLTPLIQRHFALIAAALHRVTAAVENRISGQLKEAPLPKTESLVVVIAKKALEITVKDRNPGRFEMTVSGQCHPVAIDWRPGDPLALVILDEQTLAVQVTRTVLGYHLTQGGANHDVAVHSPRRYELSKRMIAKPPADLSRLLLCPMPGLLVALMVKVGDTVEAGQVLATVEAMKMENILRAERRAVIKALHAKPGDSLAVDALILEFD